MRAITVACAVLLAAGLAGCAMAPPPAACPPGFQELRLAEAYFGRNVRGRPEVSEAEWDDFAAEVLTPRFPDGLSVADIAGQWRNREGRIIRERSKLLRLVMTDPPRQRPLLEEAAAIWRARFAQESVLLTDSPACARF